MPLLSLGGNYFVASAAYLLARFVWGKDFFVLLQAAFSVCGAGIPLAISVVRRRKTHPFYTVISAFFAELPMMAFLPAKEWVLFLANSALSASFCFLLLPSLSKLKKGVLLFGEWEGAVAGLVAFALGAGSYSATYFGVSAYYLLIAFLLPTAIFLLQSGALPLVFAVGATALSGEVK